MSSTINTSRSKSLFRPQRCKISGILRASDSTLAISDGTLMVDCGTLTAGDGTLVVGGGTLTDSVGMLVVSGSTLTVDDSTLTVSGDTLTSDGHHQCDSVPSSPACLGGDITLRPALTQQQHCQHDSVMSSPGQATPSILRFDLVCRVWPGWIQ
jgi:hypothetical protein